MMIDTGVSKSICSDTWLDELIWTAVQTRQLSTDAKPFCFAGNSVPNHALACLFAKVTDINWNDYYLRQKVFVLPSVPISFRLRIQMQWDLGFDLFLRQENGSHARINKWNATVPLHIGSHLWLKCQPDDHHPQPNFDWSRLINSALDPSLTESHFAFPVNFPTLPHEIMLTHEADQSCHLTPPWEQDDWVSGLTDKTIDKIHRTLSSPKPNSMLQIFRRKREQRKLPKTLRSIIEQHTCRDCDERAQLLPVSKISMPAPAYPNLAVTLDVMKHAVHDKQVQALFMLLLEIW